MSKNKLIAIVIWFVTILIPFNLGFMTEPGPDLTTLFTFLFTLLGMGLGGYFFSKKDASKHADA